MSTAIRKTYTAQDKAKIVLETLKEKMTVSQITAKYGAHSTQIGNWKKQGVQGLVDIFSGQKKQRDHDKTELIDELYKQIGQLKVELDWMKKKADLFGR